MESDFKKIHKHVKKAYKKKPRKYVQLSHMEIDDALMQ